MPSDIETYKRRIQELEQALNDSHKKERYYKDIAKLAGRKRLLETKELSDMVSTYREDQKRLSANSIKLEELVEDRTRELNEKNIQLRHTIQEQKQTQEQLQHVVELDRVILETSSQFINQPAHEIDKDIVSALEKIGRYSHAHRVSLFIIAEESDTILNTHDWQKEITQEYKNEFHDVYFSQYLKILRQKNDIILYSVEDLIFLCGENPQEVEKEKFQPLLAVPMLQRGHIYGALFLYGETNAPVFWSTELVTFVKIIGDVFVNALERKVSELAMRESEERYRDLVEKAGLAIVMDAEDGTFHYFNHRFADLFGYTESEMSGQKMKDLIYPDDLNAVLKIHKRRFQNKKAPNRYEFRGVQKNGGIIYLEVDVVSLKMKDQMIATRSYIWDVSHRVQAEQAVQESEERYRSLVENFMDIVLITNYDGNMLYSNPAFEKQTGYRASELKTKEGKLEIFPGSPPPLQTIFSNLINDENQESVHIENLMRTKGGEALYHSLIISKISYDNKPALQFIAHNITEEKKAANALKRSADFERTVSDIISQFVGSRITDESIQHALQAVAMWSHAGRATIYRLIDNGRFLSSMYEWCDEDIPPQKSFRQNIPIEQFDQWSALLAEHGMIHVPDLSKLPRELASEHLIDNAKRAKSFLFLPFRVQDHTYGAISLEDTTMTDRWSAEDIKLLRLTSEIIGNVFERIEAEKMLRRSEEQYRTLFESSSDEIYVHGFTDQMQASHFLNVNQAACERLGYSKNELYKMTALDIDAGDEHGKVNRSIRELFEHKHTIFETDHKTKNGQLYPVEVSSHLIKIEGKPIVMSIARDTTERKRIEEEVQKSQRLESIGILAGGIAHDFNNLLSIILGNAQLAKMMSLQNKDVSKFLNNIEEGAAQASGLTRQLLTFSKGGAPIREVYPLPELVQNAVQLALSGSDKHAAFDFSPALYNAKVDKGQIHQVIHNIILNSDQAMPNGGLINVSARNVHSDQVKPLRRLEPGHYVQLSIQDHGIGIPASHQQKIFDPYYTTKEKGNGLGLTVAHSIIKKHDGLLLLKSVPNQGTTVDIFLPAVHLEHNKTSATAMRPASYKGGAVFIMDDERLVLDVTEKMLQELGFTVRRALNGEELVQLYQTAYDSQNTPDLVIMDLTIPAGMGGMEAITKLRKIDPKVKAIVSSGYSNDKIMSHYQQYGFSGVVAKPYTLEDLQRAVAKVLAQ